jgi:hypothetical protein
MFVLGRCAIGRYAKLYVKSSGKCTWLLSDQGQLHVTSVMCDITRWGYVELLREVCWLDPPQVADQPGHGYFCFPGHQMCKSHCGKYTNADH